MPATAARHSNRALQDRTAAIRSRKAMIRPAITWGDLAARTVNPSTGEPYSESYVRQAVNNQTAYPESVLDQMEPALDAIERERELERAAANLSQDGGEA